MVAAICSAAGAKAESTGYNWTGLYAGAHTGAAIDYANFSNPYGATLYGDDVRSPGPFVGGQLGYNYQIDRWIVGAEADATWANLQGTGTCMQPVRRLPDEPPEFAGGAFGATCQVEPDAFGTIVGKAGLAFGPGDRILAYGKGGLAWIHNHVEAAQNNASQPFAGPANDISKTSYTQLGWTLGAGLEYALTSRWSIGIEYDYLHFANRGVATPNGQPIVDPDLDGMVGSTATDGRGASVSQNVHAAKLALNYWLGERGDPLRGSELAATGATAPVLAPGFDAELGGRYVYARMRFQKDLADEGRNPLPVNNSRLTWDGIATNGYELYGRIDTPWNVMLKGFVGVGRGDSGHIRDEDWGVPDEDDGPPDEVQPYSNTGSNVTASLDYFTLDAGYDVLRTDSYRVAPFIGYNYFRYKMNALGCTEFNDLPAQSCDAPAKSLFLQEMDEWRSLRLGTSAELMLTPQLKLTAEAAYLPHVSFQGVDNHPLRTSGSSTRSPENGVGTGVQLEGIVSYDITGQLSLGIGGRYVSMQVPAGLTNLFLAEYQAQRFTIEQAAVFAQGSYKLNAPD